MATAATNPVQSREAPVAGAALRRIIDEVAVPVDVVASGYNRTYNRHNR
jgi:hypothetical protein